MMFTVLFGDHPVVMLPGTLFSAGTMLRETKLQMSKRTIPLLKPHHHMVVPHYMGRSTEIDIKHKNSDENHKGISRQDSFSSQSLLQDIPLLLPQEADGLAASNVDSKVNNLHTNSNHLDQPTVICGSFSLSLQKPEVEASVPDTRVKGFVDDLVSMDLKMKWIQM